MAIISHPANKKFRKAYDEIFKKKKEKPCPHPKYTLTCTTCGEDCGESENGDYAPWLEENDEK